MSGKIKDIIDNIIEERSNGNPAIAEMTKAKLILKGINPSKFHSYSTDDRAIMEKLLNISDLLNVKRLENNDVKIKAVFSTKCLENEVALDIKSQLKGCNARLVIYFASPIFDQGRLSNLMKVAFEDSTVVGCSTAGEIVSGKMLKNSVVAMAINENIVSDAKVEIIENMKENISVGEVFCSFDKYFNESSYNMDATKYVGIVLIDGISRKEEKMMDLIGNRTNVIFVGGSAGDDSKFVKTHVCANGKAFTDAAVLIMLKISDNAEFNVIKTQSFKASDHILIANKVNEVTREVIEFNNRPAIFEYADAVGATSIEAAPNYFMTNPVGLLVGENNIFIRSPQGLNGTNISFYCNILEGMEVKLLEPTDIIEDTKKAIENQVNDFGEINGIINFNCIERTSKLEENNLQKQYAEIFSDIPTIGFSTYGEEFIGHMNQTSTMLIFRSKINS